MAIKISGSTIIDDSRNIVAGVAATFTGNVIVGSGVTINSTGVIATGIVTAASFSGSGENLTGIGTANVSTSTLNVVGVSTFSNHISLGDDVELRFGDGNDAYIYWDGNNYVSQSSGTTYLRGNTVYIGANGGSGGYHNTIIVEDDGDQKVSLYTNGNKKFETTTSGVSISGNNVVSGSAIVGSGVTINSTGVIATGIVTAASFDGSLATTNLTGTVTNAQLAGSIADSKLNTISTAGKVDLAALEIDGGTDIGAALADADLFIVDDAAGGTNRKTAASRIKTYIADVTLTTAAQTNITSLGTLSAVTVSGDITANGNITGDAATIISGISTVGATTFYGKLNNLTFPSANGSDGQVLTSDGAGVAQWEDASGGSVTSDAQRNTLGGTNAGDSFDGTNATDNTLFGYDSGTAITTGDKNTLLGSYAGDSLTSSSNVTAIGYYAASTITTQSAWTGVTAVGSNACKTSTGQRNTVVGFDAFKTGSSGGYNCILGNEAYKSADGSSNIVIGDSAHLYGTSDASYNIVLGRNAFVGSSSNHASSHSISIGYDSMYNGSRTTAYGNIAIGSSTGKTLTTGSNCVIIGNSADASSATVNNEITLGNSDITKFRIPGVNFSLKDTTATEDYVLTVDSNGDCGWEAAGSGITTADVSSSTLYVVGVSTFAGITTVTGDTLFTKQLNASGVATFHDHVHLKEDKRLYFGDSNEGFIYWDGNNFLTQSSGTTYLRGDTVYIGANGGSGGFHNTIIVEDDGDQKVSLYTNGSKKLETTTSGVSISGNNVVSGNVTAVDGTFTGDVSIGGTLTYEDVTNIDSVGLVTARSGIEFGAAGVGGTIRANGNTTLAGIVTASGFYVGGTQVSGTTINNNANNRIITGSGTANTLEAETSLEWNATNTLTVKHDTSYQDFIVKTNAGGGELELFRCGNGPFRINNDDYSATGGGDELVVGRDSGDRGMTIASGNSSKGSIFFGDDGDGDIGKIQYDHSANAMIFTTNTGERLHIDSAGDVGIGTASPSVPLHVYDATSNEVARFQSGDATCYISFRDSDSNATATSRPILGAKGDNMFFQTGGSERLRINSSGNLLFSNTSTEIRTNSSDGSDNKRIILCGGGDNSQSRGAQIALYGNEYSSHEGRLQLLAGNSGDANGVIQFYTGGEEKVRIEQTGRVGINSATPGDLLEIHPASNNQGLTLKDHGIVYPAITFDVNRTGTDQFLGNIRGMWNGTVVANILFETGSDTTNKDDGVITFRTAAAGSAAERMRIGSDGKVGIGEDTPLGVLHVKTADSGASVGTSADELVLENSANTGMTILSGTTGEGSINFGDSGDVNIGRVVYMHNGNYMYFNTNDAERLRIDSSGKVLVGHTAAIGSGNIQVFTKDDDAIDILSFASANSEGGRLTFYRNKNTTYGSNTTLAINDQLGRIDFRGMNTEGTDNYEIGASIRAEVDGTPGSGSDASDMPGRLMFFTTPDGSDSTTERLRIDSSGNVGINESSPDRKLHVGGSFIRVDDGYGLDSSGSTEKVVLDNGFITLTTNSSERLRIASNGRVGIGTDIPQTTLDVFGEVTVPVNNTLRWVLGTTSMFDMYSNSGGSLIFRSSGSEKVRFGSDGNVLIGTTTEGNANSQLTIADSGNAGITIRSGDDDWGVLYFSDATSGTAEYVGAVQYNHASDYMMFRTGVTERLRITGDGDVLINATTTSNNAILFVSGQGTEDLCGSSNTTQYPIHNDIHFTGSDSITANRTKAGIRNDLEYSITTSTSSTSGERVSLYGIHSSVNTTKAAYTNVGGYFYVSNGSDNATTTQTIQGVYGYGRGYGTGSDANFNIYGGYFLGYRGGNVSAGHCYGVYARAHQTTNGSSKGGDMTGVYAECEFDEENITNAYAFRGHMDRDAGTITNGYILYGSYAGDGSFTNRWGIHISDAAKNKLGGDLEVVGALSKGSGSFRIPHPLVGLTTTKDLVHSFIEGPQCDLIYRGKTDLVAGISTVNIDTKAGMTEGTFVALNRDIQCFTSNETGWTAVKGSVTGNKLTIIAQDNTCTDTISWMVVGERQDDNIKESTLTDADGNLIIEPDKPDDLNDKYQAEGEKNIYNEDPNINPNDEL